jgi:hypothetical protein
MLIRQIALQSVTLSRNIKNIYCKFVSEFTVEDFF